jgi:hypothetical protein
MIEGQHRKSDSSTTTINQMFEKLVYLELSGIDGYDVILKAI